MGRDEADWSAYPANPHSISHAGVKTKHTCTCAHEEPLAIAYEVDGRLRIMSFWSHVALYWCPPHRTQSLPKRLYGWLHALSMCFMLLQCSALNVALLYLNPRADVDRLLSKWFDFWTWIAFRNARAMLPITDGISHNVTIAMTRVGSLDRNPLAPRRRIIGCKTTMSLFELEHHLALILDYKIPASFLRRRMITTLKFFSASTFSFLGVTDSGTLSRGRVGRQHFAFPYFTRSNDEITVYPFPNKNLVLRNCAKAVSCFSHVHRIEKGGGTGLRL